MGPKGQIKQKPQDRCMMNESAHIGLWPNICHVRAWLPVVSGNYTSTFSRTVGEGLYRTSSFAPYNPCSNMAQWNGLPGEFGCVIAVGSNHVSESIMRVLVITKSSSSASTSTFWADQPTFDVLEKVRFTRVPTRGVNMYGVRSTQEPFIIWLSFN